MKINRKLIIMLGSTSLLAASLILFKVRTSTASDRMFDFGDVKPGDLLVHEFSVANTHKEPILLSGLDKACGVQVTIAGNQVILPGQTQKLKMQTLADRVRGPGGIKFSLNTSFGKMTQATEYTLIWNVIGGFWVDASEIWIDDTPGSKLTCPIHGLTPKDRVSIIKLSSGFSATVNDSNLVVTRTGSNQTMDPYIELSVQSGSGTGVHRIPIYLRQTTTCFAYPETICLSSTAKGDNEHIAIIGDVKSPMTVKCSDSKVICDVTGKQSTVKLLTGCSKGRKILKFYDANVAVIATVALEVID